MSLSLNPPLADLATDATTGLHETFGHQPIHLAAAPGRVNLIGEHIDYCDGFVLPFAIERYVVIAAHGTDARTARISSSCQPTVIIDLDSPLKPGKPTWANYLRGVLHGFQDRGHHLPGFDAHIVTSVPLGAGLSSSAALECALATLLEGLLDTVLDTKEKAVLCQKAEHDFAGVPCGIMDQYASAFGQKNHLILIDCQSGEPDLVPFENPDLTVLIANTCVHHELTDGGYAARRTHTEQALEMLDKPSWRDVSIADIEAAWDQLGDPINRRARHVVSEIARTQQAAKALENAEFTRLGQLMAASHASLRDDYEVSCKELDVMVEIADAIGPDGGVIGSRMTGGGFGGSTVTLCDSDRAQEIATTMSKKYTEATGIEPEIFASRPAHGAHLIGQLP